MAEPVPGPPPAADATTTPTLRRGRFARDPLGLRRALPPRLIPLLVAAMALLAALAGAGAYGAAALAQRWQAGAAAAVTVQMPGADAASLARAAATLRAVPGVAAAQVVDPVRLAELLRPWLGEQSALPLPGVIELRLAGLPDDAAALTRRIAAAVPGAEVEAHGVWLARLVALARSVQAMALAILVLVTVVAAAVVAVAARAGLAARREAILLLHDLGATHGEIAGRFAQRLALLAAAGAVAGSLTALPVLWLLADIAAPFVADPDSPARTLLPLLALAAIPPLAALIGWVTAQATVRRWLSPLP